MKVVAASEIRAVATMPRLLECLREAFSTEYLVPPRQVLPMPGKAGDRLFVSMPVFHPGGGGAVKIATLCPDNRATGLPVIHAAVLLFSKEGAPVAVLDGTILTQVRTAAASALASIYLSRPDSTCLTVIGTGALAPFMAWAHAAVRPISSIRIWGRSPERAAAAVEATRELISSSVSIGVASSLADAVAQSQVISCATSSATPVLYGRWLKPGSFVDLVGSFSPSTRECDDDVVTQSRVFVDTFAGAMSEAGDLLDPLSRGVIDRERIEGDLRDLVTGRTEGRRTGEEITLFKSVGTAVEDLAVAQMIASSLAPSTGVQL